MPGARALSHPPYRFLFDDRKIDGEVSADALKLPSGLAPAPGRQIVASERARTLVAYLQSLNTPYEFPEARPATPAAATTGGGHK